MERGIGGRSALLVLAVVLVFSAGLPLMDALLPAGNELVAAGTRTDLLVAASESPGVVPSPSDPRTGVAFVPATGWEILVPEGSAEGVESTAAFAQGAVSFHIEASRDRGGCEDLLAQSEADLREVDASGSLGAPQSFSTESAVLGLTSSFSGARVEGLAFALCARGLAVRIEASGPSGSLRGSDADPIIAMARSVTFQ